MPNWRTISKAAERSLNPLFLPNRTWEAETGRDDVSVIWLWQTNPSTFHPFLFNAFCFEEEKEQTFDLLDRSRGKERVKLESLIILLCSSVHVLPTSCKVEIKGNLSEKKKPWSNCTTNTGTKKSTFL